MSRWPFWLLWIVSACSDDPVHADRDAGPDAADTVDASFDAAEPDAAPDAAVPCPTGELAGDDGVCATEATVTIRTTDGVELYTTVLLPDDAAPEGVPTLLWRSPYNGSFEGMRDYERFVAQFHAGRGYAFVTQDVRGRPESTGEFLPSRNEIDDGRATVDWIVAQPWSNGDVGTIGGSYLGYTALAAAVDHPAVKVVIADDPSMDETTPRPGGTFWTSTLTWWRLVEDGTEASVDELVALSNTFDLPGADELYMGHDSAYWNEVAAHEDIGLWPEESIALVADRLCVPTLIVYSRSTGWRDPVTIYEAMRAQGCPEFRDDVRLVVTPEPHTHHLSQLGEEETSVNQLMLDVIDRYLGGRDVDLSSVPAVQWADEGEEYAGGDEWPVPTVERTFELDPAAETMGLPGTPGTVELELDPAAMDACSDYPAIDLWSPALDEDVEIVGDIRVDLQAELDVPDADFFADLYELVGDELRLVQYGATRARYREGTSPSDVPADEPVTIPIRMFPVAHRARAGSTLVLHLTNGACSWFENPLSGEPTGAVTHPVAGNVRFLGGTLRLPVR